MKQYRRESASFARLVLAGARTTHRLTPGDIAFWRLVAPPIARGTGAVVIAESSGDISAVVRRAFPHLEVRALDPSDATRERHLALTAAAPVSLAIVDVGDKQMEWVTELVPHLVEGGTLVVRHTHNGVAAEIQRIRSKGSAPGAQKNRRLEALAICVGSVRTKGDHLVIRCRRQAWAVLRESETNTYLAARGSAAGKVLQTIPARRFHSRASISQGPAGFGPPLTTDFDVPELSLRHYRNVTCGRSQVTVQDHIILPDTYRHNQKDRLQNRWVRPLGPRFALARGLSDAEELPGIWFQLDSEYRGHFGHALTEQVSRLWAWREAKLRYPDLRALMIANTKYPSLAPYERALYRAAGIADSDLFLVSNAVRVHDLVAATPMFSKPAYVHPGIAAVWGQIGNHLYAEAGEDKAPSRLFVSRRTTKRACLNATEVEDFFQSYGFEVIFPEDLPLAEQARYFRQADIIAGYAGSAMFNILFCDQPKDVILISSEGYDAKNEVMISAVLGHRLTIAWAKPETPRTENASSYMDWYHSDYFFQFEREGRVVIDHLRSL